MTDFKTPAGRPRLEDFLNTGREGADQGGEVPAEALSLPDDEQLDHAHFGEDNLEAFEVAPKFGVPPCFTR